MLEDILTNLLQGITVIEDEVGSVNKVLANQIGTFAKASGKTVCYLEPPGVTNPASVVEQEAQNSSGKMFDSLRVGGGDTGATSSQQSNRTVYEADPRYLPLEDLKFDLVIFESFSSYVFGKSDHEVVDLVDEIVRLSKGGNMAFILTSESGMLNERVNAYIRSTADSVIVSRTDINQSRINRTLFIPKLRGTKPPDKLIKITIEDGGIEIDTREFVG